MRAVTVVELNMAVVPYSSITYVLSGKYSDKVYQILLV